MAQDLKDPGNTESTGDIVLFEQKSKVAFLTINRPNVRNSLSLGVIAELRQLLARCKAQQDIRVVVLTGAGDKAFCAGADLGKMFGGPDVDSLHDPRAEVVALFNDLWGLGKPTVAKVRGYALAGGFGLALSCDFVVASQTAVFGTPELDVGLWPYVITVPILRSMSPKKALELMMTSARLNANEGFDLGFVNNVVADEQLDSAVDGLCAVLASKPPAAMSMGKTSFYRALDMTTDHALSYLQSLLTIASASSEVAEGIQAFFEKRSPSWKEN
ncbi:MAG: enoyl-CoA hydratase-related protein [Actinobacteria bacterium]|jgi:enoyl-CoA hydratase/carnithine racemase|nr:enoyl-CoA hydratase-related protein [Actinomycetota bacterium]MCL6104048.1 enoyl-CoA hydratase-related protein [Actinomycetota bacterium]